MARAMNLRSLAYIVSSLGPCGYAPASGTVASFLIFPFYAYISSLFSYFTLVIACIISTMLSLVIINYALPLCTSKDPAQIVLDECVGLAWALLLAVPSNMYAWVATLLLFRFFDIRKPFIVGFFESIDGAVGIVFDDIAAGLLAASCVQLINVLHG